MNAITGVPAAYRPRDLGPRQVAHLKRVGWIDNRTVRKSHVCGCSPYLCEVCNPRRSEPK